VEAAHDAALQQRPEAVDGLGVDDPALDPAALATFRPWTYPVPDYVGLLPGDLLSELGDDASKWAAAFIQIADKIGRDQIDRSLMLAWFASAIEHSTTVRRNRK
jgi:hypothetical protein